MNFVLHFWNNIIGYQKNFSVTFRTYKSTVTVHLNYWFFFPLNYLFHSFILILDYNNNNNKKKKKKNLYSYSKYTHINYNSLYITK